ncbi:hypothetical protein D1007_54356 [Hordeum vulgare]|nr:hypothetical protein D1007_54356 [Hordeum vulgare]
MEVDEVWSPAAAGFQTSRGQRVQPRARSSTHRLLLLFCCGSSSAGASSSLTVTSMKRRAEELGPLAVKLEDDADQLHGGVIGPEDYLPRRQEDHLMRAIMERSVREAAEDAARNCRKLEIE